MKEETIKKMLQEASPSELGRIFSKVALSDLFTMEVCHDLKAPIRFMEAYLATFMDYHYDALNEDGRKLIDKIRRVHAILKKMMNKLTHVAFLSCAELKEEEIDPNDLLAEVKEELEPLIEERNAQIKIGDVPKITFYKSILKMIFTNLITNGIKYNDKKTPLIKINGEELDDDYLFSVKDNGRGIKKEDLEKIFTPTYPLHKKETPTPNNYFGLESTKIGLPACKKGLELNGGELWVESEVGKGSTFYFKIPKSLPYKSIL